MYALPRALIGSLKPEVSDLKERMHTGMTRGEHNEVAILKAALSLMVEMLSDRAITFPSYYVSTLSKNSPNTLPSPRYQVLLCVGKRLDTPRALYMSLSQDGIGRD